MEELCERHKEHFRVIKAHKDVPKDMWLTMENLKTMEYAEEVTSL